MRQMPVAELLKRCLEQDPRAWQELVSQYRSLVYSVPLHLGLSAEDAAEVFQDVFESLLRNLDGLREVERLASWLYTAAKRLSLRRISALRRQAGRESHEDAVLLGLEAGGQSLSERLLTIERQGELMRLIEALPERCRVLLTALFLDPDEPDYDEISARLGIPRGAIGPTRMRCLHKLHASMTEHGYPFQAD
jgi:RNA polymerase sigma factor (sigma-70 family)